MKQINPYNILGFFEMDPPQGYAPILAPVEQLLPFQVKITGTGLTVKWSLVHYDTGWLLI
jgi:hypothetical protein